MSELILFNEFEEDLLLTMQHLIDFVWHLKDNSLYKNLEENARSRLTGLRDIFVSETRLECRH